MYLEDSIILEVCELISEWLFVVRGVISIIWVLLGIIKWVCVLGLDTKFLHKNDVNLSYMLILETFVGLFLKY